MQQFSVECENTAKVEEARMSVARIVGNIQH